MAFTKIVGAGIHTLSNVHTHNINSSGIITATNFVGVFSGTNGDFSGDVTIDGNLTVNGNTTTLDTTLQEVDQLFVSANNTNYAGIITQTGTGNILGLFDGSSRVFNVADGGATSTGALTVTGDIEVVDSTPRIKITDSDATGNAYAFIDGQGGQLKLFADLGNNLTSSKIIFGVDSSTPKMVIDDTGAVMINTANSSSRTLNLKGTFGILSASQTGVIDMSVTDAGEASIAPYVAGGSALVLKTNASGSGVAERFRITSAGNVVFKDKDSGHTGGGFYSRTKTCSGGSTTSFMRFVLTHGALAGAIYATASNNARSIAKSYTYAVQYGDGAHVNIQSDSGDMGGTNFSVACNTSANQHDFEVTVTGSNDIEVNLTVVVGCANQDITYTEL